MKKITISVIFLLCVFVICSQVVTVNFANKKAVGHPEVFGVVIKSDSSKIQSFDMLEDYGIKMIRATAPMNVILPETITESEYLSNQDDIQNPDNWPGWNIHSAGNGDFSWAIKPAKERGMKTLLSIGYYPDGLSWGSGGSKPFHRVPNNWEIHKDLYKRTYNRFKDYVDMVGISNEPNFMEIDGSPYANKSLAYKDMYRYAAEAIREVSPTVLIVGPEVAYKWESIQGVSEHPENLEFVSAIVNAIDIPDSNLNVISYHHYFEGVDASILDTLTNLPVFITEWNANSGVGTDTTFNMSGKESLAWVGNNLIELINSGANGSCMFMHYQRDRSSKRFGTFEWDAINNVAIPHLNMKSFALLSKSLKLGDGESEIFENRIDKVTNALGAKNIDNDYVIAISNLSAVNKNVTVKLENLPFSGVANLYIYEASENSDVFNPKTIRTDTVVNGKLTLTDIQTLSQSIIGILIKPSDSSVPCLNIISPNNNEIVYTDSNVLLVTNVSQLDSISKIEYYCDLNIMGESTVYPYSLIWSNITPGRHILTAKAYTFNNQEILSPSDTVFCKYKSFDAVQIIGEWKEGTVHKMEDGINRVLIFTAHAENNSTISLDSVTYGGQLMTKIDDKNWGSGWKSYVAAFYLDENGINNTTDSNFVMSWSSPCSGTPTYSSVFLQNVNQYAPIGQKSTSGATAESLETSSLQNRSGDMAILSATSGETGTYSVDNGFVRARGLNVVSGGGVVAYFLATGENVVPGVSNTISHRQALMGFIINSLEHVDIVGDWRSGSSHAIENAENRLLILTAHVENNSTIYLDSVYFGDQPMKKIIEKDWGASWKTYVAAFYLDEKGIINANDSAFTYFWSNTPFRTPTYSSVLLKDVYQLDPIGVVASNGMTGGKTIQTTPLIAQYGDLAILAASTGETGTYDVNNGFYKTTELSVSSGDGVVGYFPVKEEQVIPSVTHSDSTSRQVLVSFVINYIKPHAQIIGAWKSGLSHGIENDGINRLLIFTAHAEHSTNIYLNSVLYGGQPMTKIDEKNWGTSWKSYVAAFYLKENEIKNATDSNFVVSWSATPTNGPGYSSVFLKNIKQSSPIAEKVTNGITSTIAYTDTLKNNTIGNLALLAATNGETGTYNTNNSFVKGLELTISSTDGVVGHLPVAGNDIIPSVTHSVFSRQAILGFVVDAVTDSVGIWSVKRNPQDTDNSKQEISTNENNYFIKIFPNPVNDNLKIVFNNTTKEKIKIKISDITGLSLYNETIHEMSSYYDFQFSAFPNGIYIVTFTGDKRTFTYKIIKQ